MNLSHLTTRILRETAGQDELTIQRALIAAFPYNKGNVDKWHAYGKYIYLQSGRKMFGCDYSNVKADKVKVKKKVVESWLAQ